MADKTEANGLSDEAVVRVFKGGPNDDPNKLLEEAMGVDNLPQIKERPADSADKPTWVEYCVSLGADREYLTTDTTHTVDADSNAAIEVRGYTKDELIELADSLGG